MEGRKNKKSQSFCGKRRKKLGGRMDECVCLHIHKSMQDIFGGQKRIRRVSLSLPILFLRERVTEPGAAGLSKLAIQ